MGLGAKRPVATPEPAHAKYTASAAERWMNCHGSTRLIGTLPTVARGSAAASEGTFAHHIAATCLEDPSKTPGEWLGNKTIIDGHTVECDQEMVDGVQFYLDDVANDRQPGDKTWVELKMSEALRRLHPALGGTGDFIRYRPAVQHLRVVDFKYGKGVLVSAEDNKQMKTYALGALLATGVVARKVEVRVVQPRIDHAEGRARQETFEASDLLDFADDLIAAVQAGEGPNPAFKAGPWCQKSFCPASVACPELDKMRTELITADFGTVQGPYDVTKIADGLNKIAPLKAMIKQLEELAYTLANGGAEIPGWKLVEKRPTRKIVDEKSVIAWAEAAGVDPYEEPAVKTPAQLEKAYAEAAPKGKKKAFEAAAKAALAPYVASVSSGNTLVPATDDRPSVKLLTADAFSVVDGPEQEKQNAPVINLF